jgi:hypothetical protein
VPSGLLGDVVHAVEWERRLFVNSALDRLLARFVGRDEDIPDRLPRHLGGRDGRRDRIAQAHRPGQRLVEIGVDSGEELGPMSPGVIGVARADVGVPGL